MTQGSPRRPSWRIIVQGGVISGLLNAVVAEDLPGPGTVFLQVSWRFIRAVGVGEEITGEVEVVSVRNDKPTCQLKTRVTNGAGEECLVGEATVYVAMLSSPPPRAGVQSRDANRDALVRC
jgi:acyl dehydratase